MHRILPPVLAVAAVLLALAGCGGGGDAPPVAGEGEPLRVAAAFYPLEEAARAIGGARARVSGLTPPGQGPHDLELGIEQRRALEEADLVLFLGSGFQPEVERAIGSLGDDAVTLDALEAVELQPVDAPVRGVRGEVDGEVVVGGRDPHVWVDPALFLGLIDGIEGAFATADPAGRAVYARNAAAYRARIAALDREYALGLGRCRTRTLVTSHAAFGYLAERYDLEQAPIAGISPDAEPDPRSLAATARKARADGVRTVFFESLVSPELAQTVAREIGARTSFLDPVEGLTARARRAGDSYLSVMRGNLERLREGLECTG